MEQRRCTICGQKVFVGLRNTTTDQCGECLLGRHLAEGIPLTDAECNTIMAHGLANNEDFVPTHWRCVAYYPRVCS